MEVRFGCAPFEVTARGWHYKAGTSLSWNVPALIAGAMDGIRDDGTKVTLRWDDVAADPGWLKLDWLIADPVRGQLAKASNVLDATWEAPNGAITPLDGYLDPYFQEVYLNADSIPIFSKLVRHVSADALDEYVSLMEHEVKKYLTKDINYGKAAKRMYNIFRLTGRHAEAAFVRELFDEPATLLYQVWSLLRAIDEACDPDSAMSMDQVVAQTNQLILDVINVLEGAAESGDRQAAADLPRHDLERDDRRSTERGDRSRPSAGHQCREQLLPRAPASAPADRAVHHRHMIES